MIVQQYRPKWEQNLLNLAHEAYNPVTQTALPRFESLEDRRLTEAYRVCGDITSRYSRSFYLATRLLPKEKRTAVRALYAFCRVADNIVDDGNGNANEVLKEWKHHSLSNTPLPEDPVALAWTDTRLRYSIPHRYAEQLIEGLELDIKPQRYETFEDLSVYCYGVASTVGLMSMHIIGFQREQAIPYAIKLGVALQMTNILRDIAEDWRVQRIYLPLQELDAYGLSERDLDGPHEYEKWRQFMRFQINRNKRLYAEAQPGISMLNPDGRTAVHAAANLYAGILDDIEAHDYDVFSRRAHLSDWKKVRKLFGIYRQVRSLP
ncbi:MAG: phytoene/squalene synthase family protein [Chloroflexi bacterium]|nr:MAG: phytoene/squalene synthase family protein [Chloroflexota bacterium]